MQNQNSQEIVIVGAARTPTGRFMGGLSNVPATELGATAVKAAVERSGIDPHSIYEVIMGHVIAAGAGQAPARQAALNAGLPDSVGATAVNKVCGSGLKAVMMGANSIISGECDVMVAGGMESMSKAPYILPKARAGLRYGHAGLQDAILQDGLWCGFENWVMGNAAEFIATQFDLTRPQLDAFAFESHRRAAAATINGRFKAEIAPVTVQQRRKTVVIDRDETIRATYNDDNYQLTTSVDQLAKLPPAFTEDGIVTAGNAPGLNDGAAAVVLTSQAEAARQGAKPLARIVGYTLAGVPPQWIFAAPARAIPKLLDKIGWSISEVDLFEINEAFAAQVLANGAELQQNGFSWTWDNVNVNGGAIALGHPLGASGTRVLVTLLHALQQRGLKRGVAALCLGGGEAVAMAIEMA